MLYRAQRSIACWALISSTKEHCLLSADVEHKGALPAERWCRALRSIACWALMSTQPTVVVQLNHRGATIYQTYAIFNKYIFPTIDLHRRGHPLQAFRNRAASLSLNCIWVLSHVSIAFRLFITEEARKRRKCKKPKTNNKKLQNWFHPSQHCCTPNENLAKLFAKPR